MPSSTSSLRGSEKLISVLRAGLGEALNSTLADRSFPTPVVRTTISAALRGQMRNELLEKCRMPVTSTWDPESGGVTATSVPFRFETRIVSVYVGGPAASQLWPIVRLSATCR